MNNVLPYDEKLVTENIKLIHKVIKDLNIYWSTEDEHQEYYDAGLEGLIKGAKTYDYSTKPGTYIYKCIKNEILHQIVLSETNKRKISKENMLSLEQEVNYDSDTTFGELVASDYDLEEEVEKNLKLEQVNAILLEQLQVLRKLDLTEKEHSKMQIAKSNAIASTSKIILQSIGIQIMTERQKYKFLEYK